MSSTTIVKDDKYKYLELTLYVVSWVIIFLFPFFSNIYRTFFGDTEEIHWEPVFHHLKTTLPMFLVFCLNNYVLLPQLFLKRRKIWYFLVIIGLLTLLWYIQEPPRPLHPHSQEMEMIREGAMQHKPEPMLHRPFEGFHLFSLALELFVLSANFGVKMYIQSLRREVVMLNMQNEKMLQELKSLKYQINPHFLMNTLNNIQSLIEINPELAQKTILHLSKLMRYMLYDNNAQNVPLQKEIDFMKYFIELMRIRYPDTVKISADFPSDNEGYQIPPLLFISFLENAFKYGVNYTRESLISVSLKRENNHLIFSCANYISPEINEQKKGSGIGLKNVRRRLDLIYGDRYDLKLSQENNTYLVEMKLPL